MSLLQAFILGIVQGITEFFPVSSSGHLLLMQALFGWKDLDQYIGFDLICHVGTLLAIFCVFYREIKDAFFSYRGVQVVIGTLPLFLLAFAMKPIKATYADPSYLPFFFLTTALLLWLGIRFGKPRPVHPKRDPLIIGFFQALAIFPGISRSGSTISAAKFIGWKTEDAITFSFLLAIPAILGGTGYEFLKGEASFSQLSFAEYFIGFITSFIFGLASLKWLIRLATKEKLMYFVWYCIAIAIVAKILI